MQMILDDVQLKNLLKQAVSEVLEERIGLLQDVFETSFEVRVLVRAIEACVQSPSAGRSEIFSVLTPTGAE